MIKLGFHILLPWYFLWVWFVDVYFTSEKQGSDGLTQINRIKDFFFIFLRKNLITSTYHSNRKLKFTIYQIDFNYYKYYITYS
jgi:hypothetical protein